MAVKLISELMADLEDFRACGWPVASLSLGELQAVGAAARDHHPGAAVVSTCQRIEVYSLGDCGCAAPSPARGPGALRRLAEVAAGLDSVVLGEQEILGQVRAGLAPANSRIRALADIAIAAARGLRAEVPLEAHTGHLLDRALDLAGIAPSGRLAVVGAGSVGRLIAQRGLALGFDDVVVVARRRPQGAWFEDSPMTYVPLDSLADPGPVDVLVTCLGSTARPLEATSLPQVSRLLVDLGTPRNVLSAAAPNVLTMAAMREHDAARPEVSAERTALRRRVGELVDRRLELAASDATSEIGLMRLEVERIRQRELSRIEKLHPELPREKVDLITRSLVNQIFHGPTERLRRLDDRELGARIAALFVAEGST